MQKIIKADALMTRVTPRYKGAVKYITLRNPKWSYFSYHVGDQIITSENSLYVNYWSQEGDHMTVWYVEGSPKKVFRFKAFALLFGQ